MDLRVPFLTVYGSRSTPTLLKVKPLEVKPLEVKPLEVGSLPLLLLWRKGRSSLLFTPSLSFGKVLPSSLSRREAVKASSALSSLLRRPVASWSSECPRPREGHRSEPRLWRRTALPMVTGCFVSLSPPARSCDRMPGVHEHGANARTSGAPPSASTTDRGASARTAGAPPSASTT